MNDAANFHGFPEQCVTFYAELARNNKKSWFDERKADYERFVMEPARDFVSEMGRRLSEIAPNIHADPRVNRSIFRPYRDVRFARDKTPYKTHLGLFFWEGGRPKMECSGYYFHLEPPKLMLAAGVHCFSKPLLETYRRSVADPTHGRALADAIRQVSGSGEFSVGGRHYKKIPRGFDSASEHRDLLLHNGLYAMTETDIPPEFHERDILDYSFTRFNFMSPIHRWLVEMTQRAAGS